MKFSGDASGFISIGEAIPEVLLDIRYYSSFNFIGERIDGYERPIALLTREAAQALKAVSDEAMSRGYRLKIFDAYRPQEAVDHFVRWAKDPADIRMKRYFYPDLEKKDIIPQHYIAEHSGHSRGSTVDLTLFDIALQQDIDMGGTFDFFGEKSHPDYTGVSKTQHANRMLLQKLMVKHGFRPLDSEWWHFTLENEPWPDTYFTFPVGNESPENPAAGKRGITLRPDTAIHLETDRLILRDYTEKDFEEYYRLKSDEQTMYYLQDIQAHSPEEAKAEFYEVLSDQTSASRKYYFLHMELKDTHKQAGSIGYTVIDSTPVGKIVHLGYFTYPEFWGNGYTSEALKRVLEYAFAENDVYRVTTGCLAENKGSERVMQKNGMKKEAEHLDYEWHDGKMKTRLEYRLLRHEWEKR